MRMNIFRIMGTLLVAGLVSPAALLFSVNSQQQLPTLTSNSANWAATEEATSSFNQIQDLAQKVRKQVGPLETNGVNLTWQVHADRLARIKAEVNEMGSDLLALTHMRNKLDPWQQQLLDRMTPRIHELVYQTRAALKKLNAQHDTQALAAVRYPQNLRIISHNAARLADTVGTYSQYVQAAQSVAMLRQQNGAVSE